jgi:hypothetical protein
MSPITVRAAAFGRSFIRQSTISRVMRSTSAATAAPAAGRPMSAVSMPSASIRWRISSLRSMLGVSTDGHCKPSRSVSSSSITAGRTTAPPTAFQS